MANLLTSGTLGVNFGYYNADIGNVGGWVDYQIYDDGTAKFMSRNSDDCTWKIARAYGIQIKYDGNKQYIDLSTIYPESSEVVETATKTIEGFRRERTYMSVTGYSANIDYSGTAGAIAENVIPDALSDGAEPNSIYIDWPIPNTSPTATLTASTPFAGKANKVSWKFSDADGDSVSLVRLVRYYKAANASSYSGTTILSSSSANSYNDNIPSTYGGGSVYYEISFEDTYGGSGTAKTSAVKVISNSAPTIPGIPILPTVINGGSDITVTWDKSTDADGNLEGYKLERSIDGGGSWTQVYQGSAVAAVTPVPAGIESVMYRVKAYDSYGEESGYAATSEYTVINNTAPTVPETITVPSVIANGSSVLISWGASTDADGEAVSYQLERSIDGGAFEVIYTGSARNYTDTIEAGWATIAYRVCAVDARGAKSGYAESDVRNIISNYAPTVEIIDAPVGNDYGVVSERITISVKVGDRDNRNLTVKYRLDGTLKRTVPVMLGVATSYYTLTHDFRGDFGDYWHKITNGRHTLTVEVTDGASTTSVDLYFTKLVTNAVITLAEPMTATEQITVCIISVDGDIPDDAEMTVEVTNNGNDSSPVWEDATAHALSGMNHAFSNSTQSNGWAFNFRVTVHGGDTRGYITSIQGGFQ